MTSQRIVNKEFLSHVIATSLNQDAAVGRSCGLFDTCRFEIVRVCEFWAGRATN